MLSLFLIRKLQQNLTMQVEEVILYTNIWALIWHNRTSAEELREPYNQYSQVYHMNVIIVENMIQQIHQFLCKP